MPMRRRGPGLIRGVARTAAIAGTATAVSGRVAHNQQQRYAAQQQAAAPAPEPAYAAAPAAPAPAPASAVSDEVAQIQQLAELHAQGILTDEEFSAKKAQILGL